MTANLELGATRRRPQNRRQGRSIDEEEEGFLLERTS